MYVAAAAFSVEEVENRRAREPSWVREKRLEPETSCAVRYAVQADKNMRATTVLLFMAGVARAFVLPRAAPTPLAVRHVDAGCVEDESCSVEELAELLAEVKAKAAEIKTLESKLTALNKDDTVKLKSMLKAEECELNGFDGCSAWCVAPSAALPPPRRDARVSPGGRPSARATVAPRRYYDD